MNRQFLTLTLTAAIFMASPMQAQETVPQPSETLTRQERGEKVMNSFSAGKGLPPHFKQLQKDFPEYMQCLTLLSLKARYNRLLAKV
jgi:4-carboxymuconolactone decarboxylase